MYITTGIMSDAQKSLYLYFKFAMEILFSVHFACIYELFLEKKSPVECTLAWLYAPVQTL